MDKPNVTVVFTSEKNKGCKAHKEYLRRVWKRYDKEVSHSHCQSLLSVLVRRKKGTCKKIDGWVNVNSQVRIEQSSRLLSKSRLEYNFSSI